MRIHKCQEKIEDFEQWYSELEKYASDDYGWSIAGFEKFYYKEQFDKGLTPFDAIENTINNMKT